MSIGSFVRYGGMRESTLSQSMLTIKVGSQFVHELQKQKAKPRSTRPKRQVGRLCAGVSQLPGIACRSDALKYANTMEALCSIKLRRQLRGWHNQSVPHSQKTSRTTTPSSITNGLRSACRCQLLHVPLASNTQTARLPPMRPMRCCRAT